MATTPGAMLALPSAERPRTRNVHNVALLVAVCGGLMAVGTLVAAWVNVSHFTKPWPPKRAVVQNYSGTMLTLTIGMAAVSAEWAVHAVRRRQMAQAKGALALTVGFGVAFLNLLWYFGRHIGFGPGRYAYGVVIFAMMTFVGVAVVAGIVALLATLARVTGAQVAGDDAEMARAAAWYWDFVAVAWIVLAYVIWTP